MGSNEGVGSIVLTGPAAVAWFTGGWASPVDRTASTDLVWSVVDGSRSVLVTTNVEHARVLEEYDPAVHGFDDVVEVPWWDGDDAFVRAALDISGRPASSIASDGHPAFGIDASADLVRMRLALAPAEQEELRALGRDTAEALGSALESWVPGELDVDVQARVAAGLENRGADAPVLIVGGDERVRRFRHPVAAGAEMRRLVMAVVVARRGGLHAAATRFASAGPLSDEDRSLRTRVLRIERGVLAACRAGATYGEVLDGLDAAYSSEGAPDGWRGHYQGGPIGFAQREFELAPCQKTSPWYATSVEEGHAVAWNPSLPRGAKVEDTYLVSRDGLERVTDSDGWPSIAGDDFSPERPAVLEVGW